MKIGLISLAVLAGTGSILADTDPYNPVGTLQVSPKTVQTGVHTNLSWDVEYPSAVLDIVDINDDDSITTKIETRLQLRVIGASWSTRTTFYTVNAYARISGSSWRQVFYGKEYDINPLYLPINRIVSPGSRIDVAARGHLGRSNWTQWYWTLENHQNVVALVNGDPVPTIDKAHAIQEDVETYLANYVDDDGNISIGPHDVIYLFDFNSYGSSGFDLQDFVCLLTFTPTEYVVD